MSTEERRLFLKSLTPRELRRLRYDWDFWARDSQLPPGGDWTTWLVKAGRGYGKTRTGGEFIRKRVRRGFKRFAFIAPTAADARDVMVEGESGILAISPPWENPVYEPSKRRVTWPCGARATLFSAEKPRQLRGPQHDTVWADELAAWQYSETWDMAMLGLRLSGDPRAIVTTTPRPIKVIKELIADSTTVVTGGSSYENIDNLAPQFISKIIKKYEGTRTGRQELNAEVLEDTEGALWTYQLIDALRVKAAPDLARIVVAVDPMVDSASEDSETGIVAAGRGYDGHGYVLGDYSLHGTPTQWARAAVAAYKNLSADRVVGEINNGGEMVETTIRIVDDKVSYEPVRASRGKATRAEPVSALYEKSLVHHVGSFPLLEDQLTTWVQGDKSPDRLDALVWALTKLFRLDEEPQQPGGPTFTAPRVKPPAPDRLRSNTGLPFRRQTVPPRMMS